MKRYGLPFQMYHQGNLRYSIAISVNSGDSFKMVLIHEIQAGRKTVHKRDRLYVYL